MEMERAAMSGEQVVEIDIPSRVDFVALVRMIVAAASSSIEALEGDRLEDLRWVTSEATTNAIEANLANDGGRVSIRCAVVDGLVRLAVQDEGPGMPSLAGVPDLKSPLALEHEGSLGIPLMRHLSSQWAFKEAANGTIVEMELHQ